MRMKWKGGGGGQARKQSLSEASDFCDLIFSCKFFVSGTVLHHSSAISLCVQSLASACISLSFLLVTRLCHPLNALLHTLSCYR